MCQLPPRLCRGSCLKEMKYLPGKGTYAADAAPPFVFLSWIQHRQSSRPCKLFAQDGGKRKRRGHAKYICIGTKDVIELIQHEHSFTCCQVLALYRR